MKSNFAELKLAQLDAALSQARTAQLPARPPSGWIKAIREALGMPATYVARKLQVHVSSLTRLEASEADDTITLASLRRAAQALDCELQYVLVPRHSLAATRESRALAMARRQLAAVSHTMALEAQATSPQTIDAQTRTLAENLLKGSRLALWRED